VQIIGATRHTVSGALIGTLNYMAPEQGLHGQSDVRSDLYSLGVVLYELLTGRPPYDADTPLAILMKHVNDPLPSPSRINPGIPAAFERIILKVLSKEPGDRYQTAVEMAEALDQAARENNIRLPEKIDAPFSFSTPEAPGEPVAVYSGSNRPNQIDSDFAKDDTANMTYNPGAVPGTPPMMSPSDFDLSQSSERKRLRKAYKQAYKQAYQQAVGSSYGPYQTPATPTKHVDKILTGVFSIPVWNIGMLILCAVTARWDAFGLAWPAELLLVALMLSMIMEAVGALGMVIPIYIMMGIGGLLAYFTLLNAWSQWYLWLLIPLIIFGAIRYLVVKSSELDGDESYQYSVSIGKDLTQLSMVLIAAVSIVAFFNPFITK
jgi:hypothetical protein